MGTLPQWPPLTLWAAASDSHCCWALSPSCALWGPRCGDKTDWPSSPCAQWAWWSWSVWHLSGFQARRECLVVNMTERLSCKMQPEWVYMLIYYKALYFSIVYINFGRILGNGKRRWCSFPLIAPVNVMKGLLCPEGKSVFPKCILC